MLTKDDFQRAIRDSIDQYPSLAPLYRAGDPRVLQQLNAMATMLAMYSAQVETAQAEPFEKVRDSTVLADSSMRGIIPKGSPCRVRIAATNSGADPFAIESGRTVLDSTGRPYRIETSAAVGPGATAVFEASQVYATTISHRVLGSVPFYSIQIPDADDDSHLCAIAVADSAGSFEHRTRYVNCWPDERIYHVETDDRRRVYVRFGYEGVIGVQPPDGKEFTLTIYRTSGAIDVAAGSPFSFEYIQSPLEANIELSMDSMLIAGEDPMDMATLRDLARYPSVYDDSAVFLGEFDFLVRKTYPSLRFLSVWNEAAEEQARGANWDNINTLFVACLSSTGEESVVDEAPIGEPDPPPAVIEESDLTETHKSIRRTILAADDSYKIKFYTPVRSKIGMRVSATISTSYVASDVRNAIHDALLDEFGEKAAASRRGGNRPLYQRVYALLKKKIPALSDGQADLQVSISEPVDPARPEVWRFIADDSLSVSVSTANITTPSWGG